MTHDTETPIPAEELREVLAYCEAATEGPWEFKERLIGGNRRGWQVLARLAKTTIKPIIHGWNGPVVGQISEFTNNEHNGKFIIRSRTDLPRFAKALMADHAEIKAYKEFLSRMANAPDTQVSGFVRGACVAVMTCRNADHGLPPGDPFKHIDTLKARVAELEKGLPKDKSDGC